MAAMALATGCSSGPQILAPEKRVSVDRALVERPVDFNLTTFIPNLTAPTAIAFDTSVSDTGGSIVLAEGGVDRGRPHIFGFKKDGTRFDIYPRSSHFLSRFVPQGTPVYGPVGGIAIRDGEIYVSHCDENGRGMISAFTYDGKRRTVVSDLPTEGDHGLTDLAFHPTNKRLYFGIGSVTNSGVVGMDNWQLGWPRKKEETADVSAVDLKLLGYRFDTPNPTGGLLGGNDIAVTAPFQPFGTSKRLRIPQSTTGKPTAALYSISAGGGDLRVEAHGIRYPAGLAFNEFGNLFVTNQGMEMRGTRPVKDDPNTVLRIPPGGGTWFGWPDFSADLVPITDSRFQPPAQMIVRTGYPEVSFLIDHQGSGLIPPDRATLVRGVFPSLSGAAKMTFVSDQPGFDTLNGKLLIALGGDRFPFATNGEKLKNPIGFKIIQLDPDTKRHSDFVYNTAQKPASKSSRNKLALERPSDVKFGPDGALYIVDMGEIDYRNGKPNVKKGSGKVLRLVHNATALEPKAAEEK
jgi:glucose/arabinose dehydrogenase